jgi:hypothetical protein
VNRHGVALGSVAPNTVEVGDAVCWLATGRVYCASFETGAPTIAQALNFVSPKRYASADCTGNVIIPAPYRWLRQQVLYADNGRQYFYGGSATIDATSELSSLGSCTMLGAPVSTSGVLLIDEGPSPSTVADGPLSLR